MSSTNVSPVVNVLNVDFGNLDTGLHLRQFVQQLMNKEADLTQLLDRKEASFRSQVSGYGKIKSDLSALRVTVSNLTSNNEFSTYLTKITDRLGLGSRAIEAVANSYANEGSYSVTVNQLATAQVKTSDESTATSDTSSANYGQSGAVISFKFNNYVNAHDTTNTSIDFNVNLSSALSLNGIVDAINQASGNTDSSGNTSAYIKAELVNSNITSSSKLQLTSQMTGEIGQFEVTVSNDASTLKLTNIAQTNINQTQAGQDAVVTINGNQLRSESNSAVSNLIDGIVLTLNQADASNQLTLNVYRDPTQLTSAVNSFVSAFNDFTDNFYALKDGSDLAKDKFVMGVLESKIKGFLDTQINNKNLPNIKSVSDLGLSFNDTTNQVYFDRAKFNSVVSSNSAQVSQFLTDQDNGFSTKVDNFVDQLTGQKGYINLRTLGVMNDIRDITKQRYAIGMPSQIEERLRDQLFQLDTSLGRMQEISSQLNLTGSSDSSGIAGVSKLTTLLSGSTVNKLDLNPIQKDVLNTILGNTSTDGSTGTSSLLGSPTPATKNNNIPDNLDDSSKNTQKQQPTVKVGTVNYYGFNNIFTQ